MERFKFVVVLSLMVCGAVLTCVQAKADGLDTLDAVINWGNGKAYFFGECEELGGYSYVRYDMEADKADKGYPQRVNNKTWPGLGLDEVLAAVNAGNGKAYFFGHEKGNDEFIYVRYNMAKDQADPGYPKSVDDDTWPGISALDTIDDAVNFGDGNIYFIGTVEDDDEAQYILTYNIKKDMAIGSPERIGKKTFPGNKITNIDSMGVWDDGRVYMFGTIGDDDDLYYERFNMSTGKMDAGYPKIVDNDTWPGL